MEVVRLCRPGYAEALRPGKLIPASICSTTRNAWQAVNFTPMRETRSGPATVNHAINWFFVSCNDFNINKKYNFANEYPVGIGRGKIAKVPVVEPDTQDRFQLNIRQPRVAGLCHEFGHAIRRSLFGEPFIKHFLARSHATLRMVSPIFDSYGG